MSSDEQEQSVLLECPGPLTILEYGKVLRSGFPKSAVGTDSAGERVQRAEGYEDAIFAYLRRSESKPALKKLLIRNRALDAARLRVLALVAYAQACSDLPTIQVGQVIETVALDKACVAERLAARRAIGELVTQGVLTWADGHAPALWNGYVGLSQAIVDVLLDDRWKPAFYTRHSLKEMRQAAQKRPAGDMVVLGQKGGVPTPAQIYAEVNKHVVGEHMAPILRTLSSRLHLHLVRAKMLQEGKDPGTGNEVIMCIGPSSSGKTWTAECLGKILGIPFGSASATDLSEEGWVGLSVSDVLRPMLEAAKVAGDIQLARYGMTFLDEIDAKRASPGLARDIGGAGVQKGLLRLIEGTDNQIGGRKGSWDTPVQVNTTGVCFILGGAFVGLEEILKRQTSSSCSLGFQPFVPGNKGHDLHEALIKFGLLPELVNRLTGILLFPKPSIEHLVQIASARNGIIHRQRRLLSGSGIDLKISPAALQLIAGWAHANRTYARGLRSAISTLVEDAVFSGFKGVVKVGKRQAQEAIERLQQGVKAA
jgi:ATP-dependent Clp protease ATP-binding subunit ClpX